MTTAHSEYGEISSILLHRATDIFDSRVEAQWKDLNFLGKPDLENAYAEYDNFRHIIEHHSDQVHFLNPSPLLSIDSIYCRDASISTDFGMILCNMGKKTRKDEPEAASEFYLENGINVLGKIEDPGTLEGGDVAWLNPTTLAVGRTYRSNDEGIRQLKHLLEPKGINIIVADLPHFKGPEDVFHLMSILSPVDRNLAVTYSPLMPISFRNLLMDMGFYFVEVPEEEFESQACNVLAVAPGKCLVVDGNPRTARLLEAAGCDVIRYRGEDISVKGGGGPTCLTRPIKRRLARS